jgi:hypothetical protein
VVKVEKGELVLKSGFWSSHSPRIDENLRKRLAIPFQCSLAVVVRVLEVEDEEVDRAERMGSG